MSPHRVTIVLEHGGGKGVCPVCGEECGIHDQREERQWRHLDTMQFETVITARVPRTHCRVDGVLTANVPWAEKGSRWTLLFERFAIEVLLMAKNITSAQTLLGLNWNQTNEIRRRAVERGLGRREEETPPHLGIDEKSFRKGHSYVTVLTDIEGKRVLEVTEGRDTAATKAAINTLSPEQKEQVLAVAMDMSGAYKKAVKEELPDAAIAHDKFHVAKLLNEAVDKIRRQEAARLAQENDDRLKHTRYDWLTAFENMERADKIAFKDLRESELEVAKAWAMKEAFRHFWGYTYLGAARSFFDKWVAWVNRSGLAPMMKVAQTLVDHYLGLENQIFHKITTAFNEGTNAKIQTIKSEARGFKCFANYRIAILFSCGKLNLFP